MDSRFRWEGEREGASVRIRVCVGTKGRAKSLARRSEMVGKVGGTGIGFGWASADSGR